MMRGSARIITLAVAGLLFVQIVGSQQPQSQPISSRAAFLRAQRASRQQQQQQQQQPAQNPTSAQQPTSEQAGKPQQPVAPAATGTATETTLPVAASAPLNQPPPASSSQRQQAAPQVAFNRTTRTADIFQNGDGYNIFVTNTCENEVMHVNIKTSRPFNGVIHTKNERKKPICFVEGNNETEFNLDISHVLNAADANYCGVVKARRESPEDKDLLSVVLAVRLHRNIELSDDKFFLLNCTNRCRNPDCSSSSGKLRKANGNLLERPAEGGEVEDSTSERPRTSFPGPIGDGQDNECTVWKFPWLITLLWCMGILLVAMTISHCIMCSSLVCRWVKTEVEEREPSVYEGATSDDEDSLYNRKSHPLRIDYDNRDIYKTSNNYAPYDLDEVQAKSRRSSGRHK